MSPSARICCPTRVQRAMPTAVGPEIVRLAPEKRTPFDRKSGAEPGPEAPPLPFRILDRPSAKSAPTLSEANFLMASRPRPIRDLNRAADSALMQKAETAISTGLPPEDERGVGRMSTWRDRISAFQFDERSYGNRWRAIISPPHSSMDGANERTLRTEAASKASAIQVGQARREGCDCERARNAGRRLLPMGRRRQAGGTSVGSLAARVRATSCQPGKVTGSWPE
jgi:hypothetical protein